MPLAWDLTAEIRAWLTREKLKDLNCHWRAHGGGYPDEVIDSVIPSLVNPTMHYEHVLGSIEVHRRREARYNAAYNGMYVWLVDLVYQLLYQRHVLNESFITRSLRYLEGIAGLAHRDTPLWVVFAKCRRIDRKFSLMSLSCPSFQVARESWQL